MPSSTPKYAIPFSSATDAVTTTPVSMANLAARVDLLLGESGVWVASAAANTTTQIQVVLSRTYPGNPAGTNPGIIVWNWNQSLGAVNGATFWVDNWTGVAGAITGFRLNAQWTVVTGSRNILWRYIPNV